MGARLAKDETIQLEKAIKAGKVGSRVKGRCDHCAGPLREMRFRGKPLTHCRCGYQWS